ncbi:MAG TPA: hypothetical protein VHB47_07060 [Thermoanaerobaculia bacterium]|nr:hypothetical protein [Thermoanaerobaculia bacterium]
MTDHPTPSEIDRLVRGTLSGAGRRRLVTHLLHGCPRCARLLAPAIALTPRSLPPRTLPPQAEPRPLQSLAQITARRQGDAAAARRPAVEAGAAGDAAALATAAPVDGYERPVDGYERPVARACAAAVRRFREIRSERDAVGLAEIGRRGLLRVETLLAAAWDLRHHDPEEMVRIAELALVAAERLEKDRCGRAEIADMRVRTWAELANAYRITEDLARAEQAMGRAVSGLHGGSGDPWLLARVADLLASLLADQRRFADAGELLGKVHQFYRRIGDHHLAGRALISRGIFVGYDNQPRLALALLVQGLELIDVGRDTLLAASAVHAILINLVECGRYRQARIQLWRSRPLLVQQGGRLSLRLQWLEGKIHAGLGDLARAEREFVATRAGFAAAGSPYNAALVALDLAAVWLRRGKTARVRELVEEMIATFRALRIAREAVAALLILREACDRDEATLDRVRTVAMLLTELERQPRRRPASGSASAD